MCGKYSSDTGNCCLRPEEAGRERVSFGHWFFWSHPHGSLWNFCSSTRDWTWAHSSESMVSWSLDHQGIPLWDYFWKYAGYPLGFGELYWAGTSNVRRQIFSGPLKLKEDAFDWGLLHLVYGGPLYSSSYRDPTSMCRHSPRPLLVWSLSLYRLGGLLCCMHSCVLRLLFFLPPLILLVCQKFAESLAHLIFFLVDLLYDTKSHFNGMSKVHLWGQSLCMSRYSSIPSHHPALLPPSGSGMTGHISVPMASSALHSWADGVHSHWIFSWLQSCGGMPGLAGECQP